MWNPRLLLYNLTTAISKKSALERKKADLGATFCSLEPLGLEHGRKWHVELHLKGDPKCNLAVKESDLVK